MKPQIELALILGFSVLLHILSAWGYYYYRHHPDISSRLWVKQKIPTSIRSGAYYGFRLIYYIGLPYLAVRQGIVPARMMGLGNQELSIDNVLSAFALVMVAFAILSIVWSSHLRSLADINKNPADTYNYTPAERILDVISYEVHWAFYRSGPIFWLGGDYYTGSFLGILLIGLEEIFNPTIRSSLKNPQATMSTLVRWNIILCMTTVFLLTRNLWVTITLHGLLSIGNFYVLRHQTPRP